MKPGRASQTALIVCMLRAAAHGRTEAARFSDPTALALLPERARAKVERFRAGARPRGPREAIEREVFGRRADMMVARTVAIDDAIRAAPALGRPGAQLVLLGAGLDGRAYRMAELADVVVYEVDHPDSQRAKRARAVALPRVAGEVRFVPVDFTRDDLEASLAAAGHDPARPTIWIWEGVVMYLTRAEIVRTLAVIERRSAPLSRLVIAYLGRGLLPRLVGLVVGLLGEPFRSLIDADEMAALLARHRFTVASDVDLHRLSAALSPALGRRTRPLRHHRVVTADRAGNG